MTTSGAFFLFFFLHNSKKSSTFAAKNVGKVSKIVLKHIGKVTKISVKHAGRRYAGSSTDVHRYGISEALVLNNENTKQKGNVLYAPIYMTMFVQKKRVIGETRYVLDMEGLR